MLFGIAQAGNIKKPFHEMLIFANIGNKYFVNRCAVL